MNEDRDITLEILKKLFAVTGKDYSEKLIDYGTNPVNARPLEKYDGYGKCISDDCGDVVEVWLLVRDGRVEEATFQTTGLPADLRLRRGGHGAGQGAPDPRMPQNHPERHHRGAGRDARKGSPLCAVCGPDLPEGTEKLRDGKERQGRLTAGTGKREKG